MKAVEVPRPSEDRRWKIIDGRMRKLGSAGHGLIEVQQAGDVAGATWNTIKLPS